MIDEDDWWAAYLDLWSAIGSDRIAARLLLDEAEKMASPTIVFMCGTDWLHHTASDPKGARMFRSIDDCQRERRCTKECGVVRLAVDLQHWVEEPS